MAAADVHAQTGPFTAPRFLPYGGHGAGFSVEVNRGTAGEGAFRIGQHVIGLSMGRPHQAEFRIESDRPRRLRLQPGDIQVVPAGHAHQVRWDACDFALVLLDPEILALAAAERSHVRAPVPAPRLQARDPLVEQLIVALHDEFVRGGPRGSLYADALVGALAVRLLWLEAPTRTALPARLSPRALQRVQAYIEEHIDQRIGLPELAGIAGMGPFAFARAFKRAVGLPPYRYVLARRVERAKSLLRGSDLTISAIAHALGFASHAHFTAVFGRVAGRTPADFRRYR